MNRIKSLILALFSALLCLSCVQDLEVKVEFNQPDYEISVGDTLDLNAELTVENSVETPKFSAPDETVGKFVTAGVFVAVAPGEVEITANVAGKSATTKVHVNVVLAEKITLTAPSAVSASSEEWYSVVAKVQPENYNYSNLVWEFTPGEGLVGFEYEKVSDSEYRFKVAEAQDGAKIDVKVSDKNSDVSQTCVIAVAAAQAPEVAAKIIRLNAPDAITENDKTWVAVTAEVVVDGSGEYDYAHLLWEFEASHPEETGFAYEKVTDAQYNIRFSKYVEGANVSIRVTDKIGEKFVIKTISVEKRPEGGVNSIEVTPESLTLFVDQSATLDVNCSPRSYDKTLLVWESSDVEVVSVNDGVVTALAEGEATVKVTDSVSGLYSECKVVVKTPVTDAVITKIVLDAGRLDMTVGEQSYQLKATCYDESGNVVEDFAGLVWSADKAIGQYGPYNVVEVSAQGVVTPKAAGFTYVNVAVQSNTAVVAKCQVTVKAAEVVVEKLTLSPAEKKIDVGQMYSLEVTSEPDFSTLDDKTITFVSSNPEVATVSEDGLVKGISYGEAVITATAANGVSATAKVIVTSETGDEVVTDYQVNLSIEGESASKNMELSQFEKLKIMVAYTNGYVPVDAKWESSDPSLVTVTAYDGYAVVDAIYDGMMTDDEKKSVTITHSAGTRSASKTIDIVRALPKKVEFVGLPENNTLYLGERFGPDFGVKVSPVQASQEVTFWGDVKIYSVANGSTTAKDVGYFELAATASRGNVSVTERVYITVIPRLVEGGSLSNSTLDLGEGESATLLIDFTPANNENYDYNVVWETSDAAVATVDKGKVTAVSEGTATITATLSNGDKLTCEVTVHKPSAAEVAVGDYYYSDGTWSTELDPSKTVIGVVFSVENPSQMGDTKLLADHPEATHGLVVALEETANIQWQASSSNVGQWLVDNEGYNYLQDTNRKCGYSNTLGLVAYNAACPAENKVLVADCAPEIELGSKTSGWYLPSYAELDMLFKYEQSTRPSMISNGAIAQKIEAAGGTPFSIERSSYNTPDGMDDAPTYWSSTESTGSSIWATGVHFLYGGVTNKSKTGKSYYIARYVFAF